MVWTRVKAVKVLNYKNAYVMTSWYLHGEKAYPWDWDGFFSSPESFFESFTLKKTKGEQMDPHSLPCYLH